MAQGFFDLSDYDKLGPNDVVKPLTESGESIPNCDGKPAGTEQGVPVPGGLKEKPSSDQYDAKSIPIPSSVTIDEKTYMAAMSQMKNSFKEAYELMAMMESAHIVPRSPEQRQEEYLEEMLNEAYVEAFCSGPLYEAVKADDKDAIKDIVKDLRGKIYKYCSNNDIKFKKLSGFVKWYKVPWWNTRMWQVLGAIYIEGGNITTMTKTLSKEFAEELGDYKILASSNIVPTVFDLFRTKFGWKNQKDIFVLLVDRKLPDEFKKEIKPEDQGATPVTEECNKDSKKCGGGSC